MKKLFCFPALELFRCLPLWKTVLFVSSRAFLLSTPTFLLSTLYKNSEATWKKATKCNKQLFYLVYHLFLHAPFIVNRKVSLILEGIGLILKKCAKSLFLNLLT